MKGKLLKILSTMLISFIILTNTAYADYYTDNTTLYEGMSNNQVINLQNNLKSLGYFNYSSTGYFGYLTKQSVISYQKANYLAPDGVVGHATAREIKVDMVINSSKRYLGVPYVWGGTSPSGFDCSGFTQYVFLENGITIPRSTNLQYETGTWVPNGNLMPGDLVFFTTYEPGPSHVGLYIGNGQFIHASSGAGKIIISDLSNVYYSAHYIGAKRIIN